MKNETSPNRVMIIAGESSGELYGALLAETLRLRYPDIDLCGIGGEKMKAAGVRLLSRIASSFGAIEAIRSFRQLRKSYTTVIETLKSNPPQVLVLIDYPDFNMRIAPRAKELSIPVFYYVSPQVWAWRPGRIRTMKKIVDFLAVILPFEEQLYTSASVPCEFVGHPIMDEIRQVLRSFNCSERDIATDALKHAARAALGIPPERPVLVAMPGSRRHEITTLLPVLVETLRGLRTGRPDYEYVVPVAPNLTPPVRALLQATLEKEFHGHVRIVHNPLHALMAADCGIIASGTSTLQAALLGVPHVIIYRVSPITFWLGRRIVKVRHVSLANILLDAMGEKASPFRATELLQDDVQAANISREVIRLMDDSAYRADCLEQFSLVSTVFLQKYATERVADHVARLVAPA
ncbi:MAG TPA: lipid-A-disaccharide synthase [Dissulfurispiraceae bacterium]|nr:lipid-A-disaccharide synthase [Dissulfurispiraceae bacterium]